MANVRLENLSKIYDRTQAVSNVDLEVRSGEFLTLLGPSGCGKTTILRMIAGFVRPTAERIFIADADVTRVPPNRRNAGVVFQNYALFPHMSAAQNIAFGLKIRRLSKAELSARVNEALRLMKLESVADRAPSQLSGGQQQRVALARAVVIRPRVLLMDEPLSALDLKLRQELQSHIKSVQRDIGVTTIYVTHDQSEALSMSDRVAVMKDGAILQIDRPQSLYDNPASSFVATFVGRTNLLRVEIAITHTAERCARPLADHAQSFMIPQSANGARLESGSRRLLGIRPEKASLERPAANELRARVKEIRYYGSVRSVVLTHEICQSDLLEVDLPAGSRTPDVNESVSVWWNPADSFLLPAEE